MKVLIVDDENKSRETLQALITTYCEGVEVVAAAVSVEDALEKVPAYNPELVFLDISMPGGTGFDLLERLPTINFEVIFVTAYDNYGIQAVKSNALDYLLKPVSIEELCAAVQKARKRIKEKTTSGDIKHLLEQLDAGRGRQNKMAIPANDGLVFIAPEEIIYLMADGSYTNIVVTGGKKVLSTRHLKEYEDQLPAATFIRVHHSYIINLAHVKQYHRGDGGSVTMADGSEIIISKRKKKDFLDRVI